MISYKDNIQVTSTTTGTGTLTQAAAVTGFAAPAAGDDGKTFTIMVKGVDASGIPTGEWELCESTYTHSGTTWSRGTLIDSSTGSRVTFSAGTKHIAVVAPARVFGAAGGKLEISNQTVTTADITGAVGNFYVCTIAGLTNHRSLTLPSAAVGERIGVYIADGDDTYSLIVKGASGQTINGGSAATEWSRVFIKGETVIFRCIAANTWIVESDGRIPQSCSMYLSTSTASSESAGVYTLPTAISGVWTVISGSERGNISDVSTSKMMLRRNGSYSNSIYSRTIGDITVTNYHGCKLAKNGTTTQELVAFLWNGQTALGVVSITGSIQITAGDTLQYLFRTQAGSKGLAGSASYDASNCSSWHLREQLP